MLVFFEPAAMCDLQTDLVLAPLPARKQLWEAKDESAWKTENERDHGAQNAFGLAANGDLVALEEDQMFCGAPLLLYKPVDQMGHPAVQRLGRSGAPEWMVLVGLSCSLHPW